MLSQVAFQQIQDNYWYGTYGPFKVIVDKSNGYINATKLCSAGGKHYHDWIRNKTAKSLVETLSMLLDGKLALGNIHGDSSLTCAPMLSYCDPEISGSVCKSITTPNYTDVDRLIAGTYCHPLLVPHIACWVSPAFALMVAEIVNSFIVEDYKVRLYESEQSAMQLLQSLQDAQDATSTTQLALEAARDENTHLRQEVNVNMDMVHVKQETVGLL